MYKQQIFQLDCFVSGENRSQHLQSFLLDSFLYIVNGEIVGFYLPSFGDGLIIATTINAGQELMKKRFQKFKMASFPEENKAAIKFMNDNGYESELSVARMYYGKKMTWKSENLYNRVGGKIG